MKSWDEQEEELDKLTNLWAEEVWKKAKQTMHEMDEFHNFLDLWVNEVEKHFGKCEVKYKLKGKE